MKARLCLFLGIWIGQKMLHQRKSVTICIVIACALSSLIKLEWSSLATSGGVSTHYLVQYQYLRMFNKDNLILHTETSPSG